MSLDSLSEHNPMLSRLPLPAVGGSRVLTLPLMSALALTLLMVVALSLPSVRLFATQADYLPLHSLFELLSIAVAMMVFLLVTSLPKARLEWHVVMLGCGFLAVGLGDLLHTLVYPAVPGLAFADGANKAILFRLFARYVLAFMLLALFLPGGRCSIGKYQMLLAVSVVLAAVMLLVGLHPPAWLRLIQPGANSLTTSKLIAEYGVILLYAVSAVLLANRAKNQPNQQTSLLAAAAWIMALSEVFFIYYTQVTDVLNIMGHLYKLAAYYMVYHALFIAGVKAPYQELAQQRSWAHSLIESLPQPIWLKDPAGKYLTCNHAFTEMCGKGSEDVVGKTDYDLFSLPMADSFREYDLRALSSSSVRMNEEWVDTAGNGRRLYNTSKVAVRLPGGMLLGVLGIANDITERCRMEAQLRQAQRMEAIGQLTAGVAHDFNNLLAVVLGNLELLTGSLADEDLRKYAQHAFDAGMRGASLTQSLLSYACKQSLAPSNIDVAGLLVSEARLLERSLEESVSIDLEIEGGLWAVHADASRLQDAILNLALNARDAMPKGGKLTLIARNIVLDTSSALLAQGLKAGRYVRLQVRDTGCGIPADQLDRVLEPFFTTKPEGAGSGLGLPMVYGFVRQTGGHFDIQSTQGVGTCISLLLPATTEADAKLAAEALVAEQPPLARPGETVLVVEDNADVRQLVLTWLAGFGYQTIATADGPSALVELRSGKHIDLLLTDVVLPNGIRGPEIAQAAQLLHPGIKSMLMSGYANNPSAEPVSMALGIPQLNKPFRRLALAQKLRELLDQ